MYDQAKDQRGFLLDYWTGRLMLSSLISDANLIFRGGRLTVCNNVCYFSEDPNICSLPMRCRVISSIELKHLIVPCSNTLGLWVGE
jgi:hypothetical protein